MKLSKRARNSRFRKLTNSGVTVNKKKRCPKSMKYLFGHLLNYRFFVLFRRNRRKNKGCPGSNRLSGQPLFYGLLLPVIQTGVLKMRLYAFVRGADDSAACDNFFQAVGAPAGNAADGKDRSVKFRRYAKHFIDKA